MKTYRAFYKNDGHPDIRILIRQERPEAIQVETECDGRAIVHTWPAKGPASVSLVELLLRYRADFGSGYDLRELTPLD